MARFSDSHHAGFALRHPQSDGFVSSVRTLLVALYFLVGSALFVLYHIFSFTLIPHFAFECEETKNNVCVCGRDSLPLIIRYVLVFL